MRDETRSLALVVLLLASTLAGVVPVAATSTDSVPSGFVGLPDENIKQGTPPSAEFPFRAQNLTDGDVLASAHASTTEFILTTPDAASEELGPNATATRGVGNLAIVVRDDAVHEGRRIAIRASEVRDALGFLPSRVQGVHEDGSTWSKPVTTSSGYIVVDLPHFSSNVITFAGEVSLPGDPATDGTSYQYDVGDVSAVSNFSIDITGRTGTETATESATLTMGESAGISIAGDLQPSGPASGEPEVTLTASRVHTGLGGVDNSGSCRTWLNRSVSSQRYVSTVSATYAISGAENYENYYTQVYVDGNQKASKSYATDGSHPGHTETLSVGATADSSIKVKIEAEHCSGMYSTSATAESGLPSSVEVSADDGTSASFGDFSEGESKSKAMDLSRSASSLTYSSTAGGEVDLSITYTERARATDPTVSVNGHSTSYSGTLANGQTVSLPTNSSWVEPGTNLVNISLKAVSADAPTGAIGLTYRHTARHDKSVTVAAEAWSERYNVSRTWGAPTQNASLKIPFAGNVVRNRALSIYLNGTETAPMWSQYRNTTLSVGLGDLAPGTETRVVATGSKVRVQNGSVQVTDPTTAGNRLDTAVEVTSRSEGPLTIAVGDTPSGDRVHYAVNESWSGADEVHRVTAAGEQALRLDAPDGGRFRVRTLPVEADPKQGDVAVSVSEPRQEEPQFYVRPGRSPGDAVKFTYRNANPDSKYLLYSKSDGVVRDSGEANSPVTLTDDDSAERLVVRLDDTGTSQPPTDDWTDDFPNPGQFAQQSSDGGGNLPLVLLVSGIGIAVLWYARRQFRGASGVSGLAGRALSSNVVLGSLVVAVVGVAAFVGGVSLPPGAGLFLLVTGVPLGTFVVLRRTGQYSHVGFGAVTAVALVLGLQLLGGNIVSQVLSNMGPAMPVVAFGGLFIAYQAVQAYREGQKTIVRLPGRGGE